MCCIEIFLKLYARIKLLVISFVSKLEKFKIFVIENKNVRRSDSSIYHFIVTLIKSFAYFFKDVEQYLFLEICLSGFIESVETKF